MSSVSIEKILSVAYLVPVDDPNSKACRWGLSLMLWGPPGIGKSGRVDASAAAVGLPPRTIYAATTQPEDVSGAAFPNTTKGMAMIEALLESVIEVMEEPDDGSISFSSDFFGGIVRKLAGNATKKVLKRVLDKARIYGSTMISLEPLLPGFHDLMVDKQGVLFLDELSCARPAVQGAYLGVVLTRRAGGRQLPGGVRIIAAGNPPDSAAGGWELEPPMANRFCHFDVEVPTVKEWTKWLIHESSPQMEAIEDGEHRVRQRWNNEWPMAKGLVSGFMATQSDTMLYEMPPEGHKMRGRQWPSPRTWEMATRAIATCRCLGLGNDIRDALVDGCVGTGAATAFSAWAEHADLPTAEEMIQNGWTPDKMRLDRSIAAYTTLISYVSGLPSKEEKVKVGVGAWRCIRQSMEAGLLDITLRHAQELVRMGVDRASSPDVAAEANPVLSRLARDGFSNFLTDTP